MVEGVHDLRMSIGTWAHGYASGASLSASINSEWPS